MNILYFQHAFLSLLSQGMLGKEGREKTDDSKEESERGLRPFLAEAAFPALSALSSETRAGGRRAALEAAAAGTPAGRSTVSLIWTFPHPGAPGLQRLPPLWICLSLGGRESCGSTRLHCVPVQRPARQMRRKQAAVSHSETESSAAGGGTTPTKTHLQRPPTHPPVLGLKQ